MQRAKSFEKDDPVALSVASWNVLADVCCDDSDQGFPYVSEKARNVHERARKQLLILASVNADIVALQEVDKEGRFRPFLEEIGYDVSYRKRSDSPLGIMIGVKRNLCVAMFNHMELPGNRFAIGATFTYQNAVLDFWSVHLKAKSEGAASRLEQVKKLAQMTSNDSNVIIAGDFNDTPESDCVREMLQAGFASADAASVRIPIRDFTTYKVRKGASRQPKIEKKTEDYIFFRGPHIKLESFKESTFVPARLEPPGLPSEDFPSDHLNIGAMFTINSD